MRRHLAIASTIGALAAGGAALAVPSAPAATRIGPDLTPVPCAGQQFCFASVGCNDAFVTCAFVNIPTTTTQPFRTPSAGVITRWRMRGGCCSSPGTPAEQTLTLRSYTAGPNNLTPSYPYYTIVPTASGATFEVPAGGSAGGNNPIDLPARMAVAANQYVGIQAGTKWGFAVYAGTPGVAGGIAEGSEVERAVNTSTANDAPIAMNFDLEPDADGDGYGDETQDCTPADPATHEACAQPPSSPPPSAPIGFIPAPPGTPPPNKVAVPIITPQTPPIVRADGAVYIKLKCPEGVSGCGGFLLVEGTAGAKKAAVKRPQYGKQRYKIDAGKSKSVAVKLSRAARKILKQRRKLVVRITIKPDSGAAKTTTRTLKLAKAKRKKR